VNICQHAYVSSPATVLPSSHQRFLHECLPLSLLLPSVLGLVACLFCLAWQYCNSKLFLGNSSNNSWGEKKLSMCNLPHACVSHASSVTSHLLLSHAVPCSVCPSPSILSCHTWIQSSQKVSRLGWWNVLISLVCSVRKSPSLRNKLLLLQQPDFQKSCTIWNMCYLDFQAGLVWSKLCQKFYPFRWGLSLLSVKCHYVRMLRYQSSFISVL
jgi:hypothetical protein